jgi:hypothetical protein
MPGGGYFNPEWGYLAPTARGTRALRIALVSVAVAVIAGTGAYVSLLGQLSGDDPPVAYRPLSQPVEQMRPTEEVAGLPSVPAARPAVPTRELGASDAAAPAMAAPAPAQTAVLHTGALTQTRVAVPPGGAPVGEVRLSGIEFGHDSGAAARRAVASSIGVQPELAEAPAVRGLPASTPQPLAVDDTVPAVETAPSAALMPGRSPTQISASVQSLVQSQTPGAPARPAAAAMTAAVQSSPESVAEPAPVEAAPTQPQAAASAQKKPVKNQRITTPANTGPLSLLRIFSGH